MLVGAPGCMVGPGGTERIGPGSVLRWSCVCSGAYPGRMILGSEGITPGWSLRGAKVKAASDNWSSPLPWTLTSTSQIIFLSCVMKSKMRQVLGFASEAGENPDTQALLTCAEKEEENQEAMTEARSPSWMGPTSVCAQHGQRWRASPGPSLGIWGSLQCEPVTLKNYCYAQHWVPWENRILCFSKYKIFLKFFLWLLHELKHFLAM